MKLIRYASLIPALIAGTMVRMFCEYEWNHDEQGASGCLAVFIACALISIAMVSAEDWWQ